MRAVWPVALIVLIGLNLRPAVTVVGPLLTDLRSDLGLSGVAAGALTTLPVLCFGIFGLFAPALRGRFREEPLLVTGMALLALGLLIRVGPVPLTLFAGSLLMGIAISIGNVAMPSLIKREHPGSVTSVTAAYSISLMAGAAIASAVAVPIEDAADGGWRVPFALLIVPAVLAGLVWLPRARRAASVADAADAGVAAPSLWRDRLAWQVTAFMGLQSMLAYAVFGWLPTICQDRGMSAADAGLVLALSAAVQMAGALAIPLIDRRTRDQRPLVVVVAVLTAAGFAGAVWAPVGLVWVSSVILGLGQGAGFALALAFIGLRAGDAPTARRLSGMAQGTGYLIAAAGPLAFGALHDLTGGWNVPVGLAIAIAVLEMSPGLAAARDRTIRPATEPIRA